MCQRYAGRAITGQIKTTPVKAILAEADLPTVATRATQLSTIVIEKPFRMPDTNPRKLARSGDLSLGPHNQKGILGPATLATNWKPRY